MKQKPFCYLEADFKNQKTQQNDDFDDDKRVL
jgi:hypothetical protein